MLGIQAGRMMMAAARPMSTASKVIQGVCLAWKQAGCPVEQQRKVRVVIRLTPDIF